MTDFPTLAEALPQAVEFSLRTDPNERKLREARAPEVRYAELRSGRVCHPVSDTDAHAAEQRVRHGIGYYDGVYNHFAQRYGDWSSKGSGNLILSRFPIGATANLEMVCNRSAGLATIVVDGRNINVVSTHLDSKTSSCRVSEIAEILPWMRTFSSPRIFAGDFNASPGNAILAPIWAEYLDGWVAADPSGTAVDYAGNSRYGATHNYRIDYILTARDSSALVVKSARVYDARDANGVRMSDHKPLMVTYEVR